MFYKAHNGYAKSLPNNGVKLTAYRRDSVLHLASQGIGKRTITCWPGSSLYRGRWTRKVTTEHPFELMNTFYELYIRFLGWLGAAPPPAYQHLFQLQSTPVAKPILTSTTGEAKASFFHNLQKGMRIWRKILFNPDLQTLREIKVETDSRAIWHWTLFAGSTRGLINVILFFLLSDTFTGWSTFFSPRSSISVGVVIFGSLMRGFIAAVGLFLFAYVLSRIINGRAKAVGGFGKFEEQNYLVAAFLVPYYLLLIIPLIGWPVLLLVLIRQFPSIARSVQVVYDLSFVQAKEVIQYPIKILIIFYSLYYLLGLYSLYQGVFVFN